MLEQITLLWLLLALGCQVDQLIERHRSNRRREVIAKRLANLN